MSPEDHCRASEWGGGRGRWESSSAFLQASLEKSTKPQLQGCCVIAWLLCMFINIDYDSAIIIIMRVTMPPTAHPTTLLKVPTFRETKGCWHCRGAEGEAGKWSLLSKSILFHALIRSCSLVNEENRSCLLLLRILCSQTGSRKYMFSSLFLPPPQGFWTDAQLKSPVFPSFLSPSLLLRQDFYKAQGFLQRPPPQCC